MVARREIGLLISQIARATPTPLLNEDEFLVIVWAIVLCTIVGPVAVAIAVRQWGRDGVAPGEQTRAAPSASNAFRPIVKVTANHRLLQNPHITRHFVALLNAVRRLHHPLPVATTTSETKSTSASSADVPDVADIRAEVIAKLTTAGVTIRSQPWGDPAADWSNKRPASFTCMATDPTQIPSLGGLQCSAPSPA